MEYRVDMALCGDLFQTGSFQSQGIQRVGGKLQTVAGTVILKQQRILELSQGIIAQFFCRKPVSQTPSQRGQTGTNYQTAQ